mgnify:CR=1 FL=1
MATEAPRTRFDLYLEDILAAPDELAAVLDLHATGIAGHSCR